MTTDPTRTSRALIAATFLLALAASGAGVSAAAAATKARPLVRIVAAPPARTVDTHAVFRIKTRAASTACRLDNRLYRRCRTSVRYRNLRPGRHMLTIRARHRGRTSYVRRSWTVLRSNRIPAPSSGGSGQPTDPGTPAQPPPPPAPPDSQVDPSNPPVIPGRAMRLRDDFSGTGTVNESVWEIYDYPGHAGNGLRHPSAVALDGQGNLVITAKMVDGLIVSGAIAQLEDFIYGRVEFRVRAEMDPTGTMNANVLTWPDQQWSPEFTENDMYETGPRVNNNYAFDTFIHFSTNATWQRWKTHHVDPTQWHTIAMEWQPNLLQIFIDGVESFTVDDPFVIPDVLHHVCIQLDAMATRTLTQPVRMIVDWIRVYQ